MENIQIILGINKSLFHSALSDPPLDVVFYSKS